MLATLQRLGIVPSFSRPKVSDDNPFIESLFRTLKYRPEYPPKPFDTARAWVAGFVGWHTTRAPAQRHSLRDAERATQRPIECRRRAP